MYPRHILRIMMICALLGGLAANTHALVGGPYPVDANTVHLYHFDGDANDAVTTGSWNLTLQNGATATTTTYAGFGSALATYVNPPIVSTTNYKAAMGSDGLKMSQITGANGAFTVEAIINPQIALNAPNFPTAQMIVSGDSGASTRAFQFRLSKPNATAPLSLTFIQINPSTVQSDGAVPTTGPDAYVPGAWYHVAVTYSGTPGVQGGLKLFWTKLDSTRTVASSIRDSSMTTNITPTCNLKFCVGNTGRGSQNGPFLGAIDEVRISKVARAASEMLFSAPIQQPQISVTPATNLTFANVDVVKAPNSYSTATVTIGNNGNAPLVFQSQTGEFKTGIKLTGDDKASIVSVTPDTATPLAAGQSVKIVLKFLPTATGFVEGGDNNHYYTLSIFTNDPTTPQVNLPLRGIAVPVELSTFKAE